MNAVTFAWLNGWEIVAILVVVLVLFGARRLPELARGLGQGIREFKKATRDVTDELQQAIEDEPPRSASGRKAPEKTVEQVSVPPSDPSASSEHKG
ncbi:MAG TPA: twin-arginine translocase TatA/TatE family subunit [Verrucomicrobia bacterium]|nr:twin-arginine translocase TatA/TatE family subunit [Verrucomicrobiota bacterium]HOB31780.1 twin-arginine translocase TatA/TatE family subunit [Verrucomicrobiota bacterium]HOP96753.1 twin-arginine translocase TatA/TatE family subunit [Verrucomicrobiota bacterium]HPU56458.1 twin-arginine translocase TatA/TatE family subunit [Verrucomicrobiota bacterium]